MYGLTLGEQTYGAESLYWRAFVEAGVNVAQDGDALGVGNPIAQGISAVTAEDVLASAPVAIVTTIADVAAEDSEVLTAAFLVESGTDMAAVPDLVPSTVVVIESSGAFVPQGDIDTAAVAVGTAFAAVAQDGDIDPQVVAIGAAGATIITGEANMALSASASEAVPVYVPEDPSMLPLARSHEADQLEAELKALFMLMFERHIRPDERYVNVLGMPQHGPRELIEYSLANDGLSIYRGVETASGAGGYLLRAWRAHNPKRGLHLLETYLQLFWPNVWKAEQMWQDKAEDYPTALAPTDGGNHFLTSRVNVALPARVTNGGDLNAIQSGLRSALPARIVMQLAIESEDNFGIGIATAYHPGFVAQSYVGTVS
jgi:hypothetical protein